MVGSLRYDEPMTGPDLHFLEAYDLVPPVEPFALNGQGVNNIARGIHTGAGDFVLKTYRVQDDVAVIDYEHDLLIWLDGAGLPFGVPTPLRTRGGTTVCGTPGNWQALYTWLPGIPGKSDEPAHVVSAGRVLGALHQVLGRYPADPRPGVVAFGDLDHIHPRVPDPLDLFSGRGGRLVPSHDPLSRWWRTEVTALRAFVADGYAVLPKQVIHGDFVLGNLLFEAGDVTGVLDWEFAVLDARAMDIATLLISTVSSDGKADWGASAALVGQGYRSHRQLTPGEAEALPWLIRLWNAVNLLWRAGRDLDIAADQEPDSRIDRLQRAQRDALWLEHHGGDVTQAFTTQDTGGDAR